MERILGHIEKERRSRVSPLLYVSILLFSFHIYLLTYINSSFLSTFVPEQFVGIVYVVTASIGFISLLYFPKIISTFGSRKTLIALILLEILAVLGLATATEASQALISFILLGTFSLLILLNLDIFLEKETQIEEETGNVRGTYLTVKNIALFLSPLLVAFILTDGDFWKIYIISSVFLVPFFFIALFRLKQFKKPQYKQIKPFALVQLMRNDKNLFNISMAHFILRFFFAWMAIYLPIYLYQHIGFSWGQIGVMFTIMLLPFALFELPLGRIADKTLGEKEILIGGLLLMAVSTAALSFITTPNVVLWTAVLFLTRAGASAAEIMTESYFFKHVSGDDISIIGLFRILQPTSYIIGPIIGTIVLAFLDFRYIFLVLAAIVLLSLRFSFAIQDTK